jgi:hypothetical protein
VAAIAERPAPVAAGVFDQTADLARAA